ncbi:MAG: GNAT family N-acetyltransferase [Cryobacterium sp.]
MSPASDPCRHTFGGAALSVRAARPDEYPHVADLVVRGFLDGPYGHLPVSPQRSALLADSAGRAAAGALLVAVDTAADARADAGGPAAAVLGTLTLLRPGTPASRLARPDEAELRILAVASAARGHGVGEALVRGTFAVAAGWGARAVVLDTGPLNHPAQRLYERVGFVHLVERGLADENPLIGQALVYSYRLG